MAEKDVLPSIESIWDQLIRNKLLKSDYHSLNRAKNCLRALAFNLIDLDNHQVFKDKKKLRIIRELRKDTVILKPDKGSGVVVIDITDYFSTLENLFSDASKFKKLNEDPTNTRLTTLQAYLRKLLSNKEISEETYKQIRPKNAKIARAHGLPKVHKQFDRTPPFRPIIDTIGSTHYDVGKYITNLLNPLTHNNYSLKDTFDAAARINNILKELLNDNDYVLISLDVVSLFTNVPLKGTVNIILDRVYNENVIQTTLPRKALKKLILDTCQKTAFTFNGTIYEQLDGVSMGASLGPILVNIIMTECEKMIVNDLITA